MIDKLQDLIRPANTDSIKDQMVRRAQAMFNPPADESLQRLIKRSMDAAGAPDLTTTRPILAKAIPSPFRKVVTLPPAEQFSYPSVAASPKGFVHSLRDPVSVVKEMAPTLKETALMRSIGGLFLLFLAALYKSEVKTLRHLPVTVVATNTPTTYTISLGSSSAEFSLSFEVKAGESVKVPFNEEVDSSTLFRDQGYYLGPLRHFIWKRETVETICDIIIEDEGNPNLANGPQITRFNFSSRESINIIHRDPKRRQQSDTDSEIPANSKYASVESMSPLRVTESMVKGNPLRVPLYFGKDTGAYLKIDLPRN